MRSTKDLNLDNLGVLLKSSRRKKGLTQSEVADMVGVCNQHYSRIERGEYIPSLQTFFKLADVLDLEISNLDIPKDNKISSTMYEILGLLSSYNKTQQKAVLSFLKSMKTA